VLLEWQVKRKEAVLTLSESTTSVRCQIHLHVTGYSAECVVQQATRRRIGDCIDERYACNVRGQPLAHSVNFVYNALKRHQSPVSPYGDKEPIIDGAEKAEGIQL